VAGFDRLLALGPQEIQVGILKRLRGTPIIRHDAEWAMRYSPQPPYEVLHTSRMDFATLGRLRRLASFWDIYGNSGNFRETLPQLWADGSPARALLAFSDWLHTQGVKTSGIALTRQFELLWQYLTGELRQERSGVAESLSADYRRGGRNDLPPWLRDSAKEAPAAKTRGTPKRQSRHLEATGPTG
jgi:hypothetical protein